MRPNPVKTALRAGKPAVGTWLSLGSIMAARFDLSASMRGKDGRPPSGEATKKALDHVLATCKKHKVAAGIHCGTADEVNHRAAVGWQFMAIGSELKMMLNGVAAEVAKLGLGGARPEMAKY